MISLDEITDDSAALRQVFGCFPSGVTAVCGLVNGITTGMAASSFTSVSVDPPLVSLCVQNISRTWKMLRSLPRMGVSVLSSGQDRECRQLSLKTGDRFHNVRWDASSDGAVFIHDAAAWLDCSLHDVLPAGDHSIALLHIVGLRANAGVEPLVFHASRFRRLEAGAH